MQASAKTAQEFIRVMPLTLRPQDARPTRDKLVFCFVLDSKAAASVTIRQARPRLPAAPCPTILLGAMAAASTTWERWPSAPSRSAAKAPMPLANFGSFTDLGGNTGL